MYNIHSHYENIFSFLKTITPEPVLLYLYPFGAINFENIEMLHCNGDAKSPIFFCFDQEPITAEFEQLVAKIQRNWKRARPLVLLNTELDSEIKNDILKKYYDQRYYIQDCYYFFHIFAAADWYRGYRYNSDIINLSERKIKKKFITFNRITGNSRAYRGIFVAELHKQDLLPYGHVSFSNVCPEHGIYNKSARELISKHGVDPDIVNETISLLSTINNKLRIDQQDSDFITNGSQTIDALPQLMESFLYVVTETCFWERKKHLTEKIFKPIVTKNPFVLLGCPNNLQYLKSYGFKTFDSWWDESYDKIDDPIKRIRAVVKIIKDICSMSLEDLEGMLRGMKYVLEHNYNLFYSQEFMDRAYNELKLNLETANARCLLQK